MDGHKEAMTFIDTHAHLYSGKFAHDQESMIARMLAAGVARVYLPNIDLESVPGMDQLAAMYPGVCFPMMGLHPCHVEEDFLEVLARMQEKLGQGGYVAIGEIGLDAYWDKTSLPRQRIAFEMQIKWGNERGLPIVIHSRDTLDETIDMVAKVGSDALTGIFHCFTGSADQANRIIDLGFYLGIGGVYTYKNSGLKEALAEIPLEKMVLETDAPYLAPVPYRGKRNESSYILEIAKAIAQDRAVSVEEVARITTGNALSIFKGK